MSETMRPRTVADIIEGRSPGVFGRVTSINDIDEPRGYATVTIERPIGVPLCGCGKEPPHSTIVIAGMPCEQGEPSSSYHLACAAIEAGCRVEIVGDVVRMIELWPLVSAFIYFDGAPPDMTVPDRTTLDVFEHCRTCPTNMWIPPSGSALAAIDAARQRRETKNAKRAEVARRQRERH